jgi:hypothetical protein
MVTINKVNNVLWEENSPTHQIIDEWRYTLECVFAPHEVMAKWFGVPVYTKEWETETYYTHGVNKDITALTEFNLLQNSDGEDIAQARWYHALRDEQKMTFSVWDIPPITFFVWTTITVWTIPELRGELFEAFADTEAWRDELSHLFAPYDQS